MSGQGEVSPCEVEIIRVLRHARATYYETTAMDCNLADQGARKLLEGGQRWLGGGCRGGGGERWRTRCWTSRLEWGEKKTGEGRRGWKQQGKVDEKNGGSNKGTDELHVKPCCQTKKNKARVGGRIGPAARERLERTGRRRTRGKIRKRRGPGHEKQKKSENMKPQTEAMDSHVKFNK